MRSHRSTMPRLAFAFVVTLVAAACGGDDDAATGSTAAPETGASEPGETTAGTAAETTGETSGETSGATTGGTEAAPPAGDDYCAGSAERDLVWAHEQEPPDMHLYDPVTNNLGITSWLWQGLWEDLYGVSADLNFYPELLAAEAELTLNDDGTTTVAYQLRDGLTWSDGTPFTSADVEFTQRVIMEGVTDPATGEGGTLRIGDRTGYNFVTDFTVVSETEFTVTMDRVFSGWKTLYTNVLPAHAFGDGAGATEVNDALVGWSNANGETLPSSGPLVFDAWEQGSSMHFVRNDSYHGAVGPDTQNPGAACVTGVDVLWLADTDAEINALRAGEADMLFTQPQVAFGEDLAGDPAFTIASLPGPSFEHVSINTLNAHLAKPEVREAVAHALNKQQIVETLYVPIFGDLLPAAGQGNSYWMSHQESYEDHQPDYGKGNVDAAHAALEAAGYAAGADGIYEHPEDGRLTLRLGTTGGNQLRELTEQIIVEQMRQAGIEVVINNVPGGDYFTEQPFSGDPTVWELALFAYVGGPWPGGANASYRSTSANNPYGYASEAFDTRADECDATLDEAEAAACYNELDVRVTTLDEGGSGLIIVPITQKPQFYVYSNERVATGAVSPDANTAGPLANVVDYRLA